jgi:hypothetical protein
MIGRDMRNGRKWVLCAAGGLLSAVALAGGCQEPSHRYVTVANGQGGVDLRREPKPPAPPSVAAALPPAPATSTPQAASPTAPTAQERIDALEAEVRALNAEVERLKRPTPGTAPAAQ